MDYSILQSIFWDNPELRDEIYQYCKSLPEYNRAEQEYYQASREIAQILGYEQYSRFEAQLSHYHAIDSMTCYLFGLNLRRDILDSFADRYQ